MDAMKQLSKNGFSLTRDNFAAVVVGGEDKNLVCRAAKDAGWLEFRVDEFLRRFPEERLLKWLSSSFISSPLRGEVKGEGEKKNYRIIGTVRSDRERQEGGLHLPEKKRLEIYKKIIDCVDYVDVEIRSAIAGEVIKRAKKRKKKVILSYHNFSKTPSLQTLKKVFGEGRKLRPDIIKVATRARSENDLFALISLTRRHADKFPLVVIPMGVPACGRLAPLYFGSLFTYISIEKKTAPGQISHEDLRSLKCMGL
ncbi:MAG: type I 3-dehydroquinate dehydratase [Candidatus Omnitrophica bacterium]|nr:type I 3-dehydroquinate dehydratase [Candidatus Omnitrophota bacterium]